MMTVKSRKDRAFTTFGWIWIVSLVVVAIAVGAAAELAHVTDVLLTPYRVDVFHLSLITAVILAVSSLIVGWTQSNGPILPRLLVAWGLGMIGFAAGTCGTLAFGDFADTQAPFLFGARTYAADLPVAGVYWRDGSHAGWRIRLRAYPATFIVSTVDAAFVRAQVGRNPVCVHLTLQQGGNAVRAVHQSDYRLPSGSVRLCPKAGV